MNAHEKRQRMRRPETFRRLSVDLEAEREAAKERQRRRDEAERQERERVAHLNPETTPVRWEPDLRNVGVTLNLKLKNATQRKAATLKRED